MSVGILLITHSGIGGALLNVAYGTFGCLPLEISHLSVCRDPDPEVLIAKASHLVRKLDAGEGVLVLTDMFGSTPSNVAQGLKCLGLSIRVTTGLNLPMLFRILNYPHLPLAQLAKKAVDGGKEGIFEPQTKQDLKRALTKQQNNTLKSNLLKSKKKKTLLKSSQRKQFTLMD